MRFEFEASDEARAALAAVGRTEDLLFSPDGTRLAIAGYEQSKVLLLDIEPGNGLRFGRSLFIESSGFDHPHGFAWLDDETLIVANRMGQAPIVRIPRHTNERNVTVEPVTVLGEIETDLIDAPGSVAVRHLSDGISEVLVCNNYVHKVTRHLIDRQDGYKVLSSDVVAHEGLNIPDGVVYSHSTRWMAISSHETNSVLIYETSRFGVEDKPVGTLLGMMYPHGLRFSPDDRAIFVADAGAPVVHVYAQDGADWSGTHHPVDALEVIEPEPFKRGNWNPAEGGPKGLVLSPDGRFLGVTCEEEPLAVFDLTEPLTRVGLMPWKAPQQPTPPDAFATLKRALANARKSVPGLAEKHVVALSKIEETLRLSQEETVLARKEAERLRNSTSWRVTWPIRALGRVARRR